MNQPIFQNADWYQAIALTERIALLKTAPSKFEIDFALAQRCRERWKSQSPLDKDAYFAQRLATDSISEEEFVNILGAPMEAVGDRFSLPPTWLMGL